ncbi:MAG: hypothetical protein JWO25_1919 [Alphaproteobacteria bacterium]|nr:hypothetical protein [Alphaproteobacteria bacterium]
MPRFLCSTCSARGEFKYSGSLECPRCGSADIGLSLGSHDPATDDEFVRAVCIPGPGNERAGERAAVQPDPTADRKGP